MKISATIFWPFWAVFCLASLAAWSFGEMETITTGAAQPALLWLLGFLGLALAGISGAIYLAGDILH